jgi:predicted esterase
MADSRTAPVFCRRHPDMTSPISAAAPTPLVAEHLSVPRSARYYTIGTPSAAVRDLWIVCHGYGQLAANFGAPFRKLESAERLIVVPEALSRFYLNTEAPHTAKSAVGALWMTREDREMEIRDIVAYLDTLAEHMFDKLSVHGVLRETIRVHVLGFSQGAPVVCRWVAFGAVPVDHVVVWGGEIPVDVNVRSIGERRPGVRFDLVYGNEDQFVTAERVEGLEAMLAEGGIVFRTLPFSGGHSLNSEALRSVFEG